MPDKTQLAKAKLVEVKWDAKQQQASKVSGGKRSRPGRAQRRAVWRRDPELPAPGHHEGVSAQARSHPLSRLSGVVQQRRCPAGLGELQAQRCALPAGHHLSHGSGELRHAKRGVASPQPRKGAVSSAQTDSADKRKMYRGTRALPRQEPGAVGAELSHSTHGD